MGSFFSVCPSPWRATFASYLVGISVKQACGCSSLSHMRKLTSKFPSVKPRRSKPVANHSPTTSTSTTRAREWSVYLIISNDLSRTYVGVTTDFSRRLKQHNGKLRGGAKASRVGRPWSCACIVRGFKDQSEACEFESKWKSFSRRLPRPKKREINETTSNQANPALASVIKHREAALQRVKLSSDCSNLVFEWQWSTP